MEHISTRADELLIQADLSDLYGILSEFVEIAKLFEDSKEMVGLISRLNNFCDIHKTRSNDLIRLKKTIDTARAEYQSLQMKYNGTKEALEHLKKAHEQLLNSKL